MEIAVRYLGAVCLVVACSSLLATSLQSAATNVRIRFIVTVNVTWKPGGCMATVLTAPLESWRSYNETQPITLGQCDHGPLTFSVENGSDDHRSRMQLDLTFFTSILDYGSDIPSCRIPWNGTYINPTSANPLQSPLPSCLAKGSNPDGSHVTYYWFHVAEWQFY